MSATAPVIVLFDGVCNLCNFAVQFMIDRDPTGQLKFASLQSEYGQDLLRRLGVEPPKGELDAFMLVATAGSAARRVAGCPHRRSRRDSWADGDLELTPTLAATTPPAVPGPIPTW
jgi:hypothetical protein